MAAADTRRDSLSLEELPGALHDEMLRHSQHGAQAYLYAVVDRGRLAEKALDELGRARVGLRALSLLNDPRHAPFKPYAAEILCPARPGVPPGKYVDALRPLLGYDSGLLDGWITSLLPPGEMARHLEGATHAWRENGEAYFLNYYDPFALPLLQRLADPRWARWFFGPVISWRYPVDTPEEERWHRVAGAGRDAAGPPPERHVLTEELWDAMARDPLPYQLMEVLDGREGLAFNSECYGVRLAQVEQLIDEAEAQGLETEQDISAYAVEMLMNPGSARDPRWQEAVREAAGRGRPLRAYFQNSTNR